MKKEKIILANKILFYRQNFNLSQQKLADTIGVSRQTINQIENNRQQPSLIIAYNIAKVFRVRMDDIFLFKEYTND